MLIETVRQLQEALAPTVVLPAAWRLSRKEETLLRALRGLNGHVLHRERAMLTLYGTWEDAPDQKIIDVFICKIRRKLMLAQARITIDTSWGRGWRMTPEACERFDAAIEADRLASIYQAAKPARAA